jgi:hypothetical protein
MKFDIGDGSPLQVWNGIKSAIHDGVASKEKKGNLRRDSRLLVNRKEISDTINHHRASTVGRLEKWIALNIWAFRLIVD